MYVAKDKNGHTFLYECRPDKGGTVWFCGGECMRIDSCLLPKSINPQWSDPEPIEVKLVRKNK